MLLPLLEKMMDGYFAAMPSLKPKPANLGQAVVIAHRGAHDNSRGVIENTHEAFRLAQEAGCWGVEFDVHATADKILVVNHDPTLNRLWGHDVAISKLSFNDLRALAPGIPSLDEVIDEYSGSMHLFIELKTPFKDEEALVSSLQKLAPGKDYHLLALDAPIFKYLSQFPSHSLLLVAVHNNVKEFCDLSINENYGGVMGNYLLLTNKKIQQLKENNQRFGVGFVNSKNNLYRQLGRGIDWIFTNQAIAVTQYLRNLRDSN